jgi:hypothetical protein
MSKKRTSLDAILVVPARPELVEPAPQACPPDQEGKRPSFKQQTVYLRHAVHEQLRRLAFDERAKMHDYLIEGLDLVFRKRGLPGIAELTETDKPAN